MDRFDKGTYCEVGYIAHSKCQRNLNNRVIEYKSQPQDRCYSESKTNTYTVPCEKQLSFIYQALLSTESMWTYAPRETCDKNLINSPQLKLQPRTMRKNNW